MKLLQTDTLNEARDKLLQETQDLNLKTIFVKTEDSFSYICAKDIFSHENVPAFRRSTVDGYACIAKDTFGTNESNPAFLDIIGNIPIDETSSLTVNGGQAVQVQTGSMVPTGADAVMMVEYTEEYITGKLAGYRALSVGENVTQIGEDIKIDECLVHKGKQIDAYDIGVLVSLGIQNIEVYQPLKITILSTGDELVDFHEERIGAKIRDINTYTLSFLATTIGMNVIKKAYIKDCREDIENAVKNAIEESDIVVLSGGSSKGHKDYTEPVFEQLTHNVFTHGISIKPGKPTLLAYDKQHQTLCIGLPGHPMAAMLMFDLIIHDWFIKKTNAKRRQPYFATIQENVSSNQGRETCLLLRIEEKDQDYIAYPLYAKSGHISCLTQAYGYTLIPRNQEGLKKGDRIRIEVLR